MAQGESEVMFLDLDLGPVGQVSFATFDDFRAWYDQEKSFFNSILSSNTNNARTARGKLQERWRPAETHINSTQQMMQQGKDPARGAGTLRNVVQQLYVSGPRSLFLSDSPQANFLKKLHSESQDDAAAALCLLLGLHLDPQQPSSYRGAVALSLYELGLPETAESHRNAIEEVYRSGKSQVATLKGHQTRLQKATEELERSNQEFLVKAKESHEKLASEHAEALKNSLVKTQEALTTHEETYSEKLALHYAVEYWELQEKRRSKQGNQVAGLFALSLSAAAYLLFFFSNRLLAGEITPQEIGAILLTVSPIFWGLRILARLLLSFMHLGTDAADRQILIKTYLALHKEGKITDDDREFLLAAIFRPASTGIVRDDAAPTWSDAFSKLGGK